METIKLNKMLEFEKCIRNLHGDANIIVEDDGFDYIFPDDLGHAIDYCNFKINLDFSKMTELERFGAVEKEDGSFSDYLQGNTCIEKVILPEGLKVIGDNAFYNWKGLKEINIPKNVQYIGEAAFHKTAIKEIHIPKGVKEILEYTFRGAENLEKVEIPNTVEKIYICAFDRCSSLKNIKIPNSVEGLYLSTFRGCTSLTDIEIPESVYYTDSSFEGCTSLTSIEIPALVDFIGKNAFKNCSSLLNISVSKETLIEPSAFEGCPGKPVIRD